MGKTLQKKVKFSKGQVSPELIERTDLEFYDSSAQKMKNVISTVFGGVRSRKGTKYIDYITNVDEATPTTVTSDVFSDTTHFTDLTPVQSNTVGNNRLFASFDYGADESGYCRIEIKNAKVIPLVKEYKNPGTYRENLVEGDCTIRLVGGGGGGAHARWGVWNSNHSGGSAAKCEGTIHITEGTYSIIVGAGGNGVYTADTGQYIYAGNGGNTSFANQVAGGGYGAWARTGSGDPVGANGAGGTYTVSSGVTGQNGTTGSTTGWFGNYGAGGNNGGGNGTGGYARIELHNLQYTLKFYGSSDNNEWVELGTRSISTTTSDISVPSAHRYRYVKIEVEYTGSIPTKFAFDYIRNDLSTSNQAELPVKMHKFIYNNEERYLLVLCDEMIQIFKDDVLVQIVTATGMTQSLIRNVKLAYKDDTIILTHPEMPPKQLQRQTNGTWVWSTFTIKNTPYYLFGNESTSTKTVSITPSGLEGSIKITAASSIFDSSWVGQYIDGNGGRVRITEYTSGTVVKGVTVIPFYTTDAIASWTYISGYEAVWSASRGYPSTCLFAQQRLWFGGSKSLPSHIWASRLDDYNNFKNAGNYENDAIDVTMLTNNRIMNMIEQRGIHIFTSGDEWTIQEGTYSPDKINIVKNTNNGSINLTPAILSGVVVFVEKNGKSLLSYIYNYDQASFITENISLFSSLIKKPVAFDTEVNSSKDKSDFIYLVLQDGTMLTGCLLLDQKIISISEYVTDGAIKDVCCLLDEVYLLVDRDGTLCLEKITNVPTDCTKKELVTTSSIEGLYYYFGKYVYVYSDTKNYGKYLVQGETLYLDSIPNEEVNIGVAYDYRLESNPLAVNGKTTSIKKRISKATVTCKDTRKLEFNGQKKESKDDNFDFYSCTKYGNDVRYVIKGEFTPAEILSVLLNINYEG